MKENSSNNFEQNLIGVNSAFVHGVQNDFGQNNIHKSYHTYIRNTTHTQKCVVKYIDKIVQKNVQNTLYILVNFERNPKMEAPDCTDCTDDTNEVYY